MDNIPVEPNAVPETQALKSYEYLKNVHLHKIDQTSVHLHKIDQTLEQMPHRFLDLRKSDLLLNLDTLMQ